MPSDAERVAIVRTVLAKWDGQDDDDILWHSVLGEQRALLRELDRVTSALEHLQVQLAGCGVAALGGTSPDQVAEKGAYGWSVAYQDVLDLRRSLDRVTMERDARERERDEQQAIHRRYLDSFRSELARLTGERDAAFKAGAEAMRKAAMIATRNHGAQQENVVAWSCDLLWHILRDLPLPIPNEDA